jgi:hypothetical protein
LLQAPKHEPLTHRFSQSSSTVQPAPSGHGLQVPPPQSTSVSSPFSTPSVQAHKPLPLQLSAPEHSSCGSLAAAIAVHEPGMMSQAAQLPAQAVSQQTASAQKPLAHSATPLQASPPSFCGTHTPASQ